MRLALFNSWRWAVLLTSCVIGTAGFALVVLFLENSSEDALYVIILGSMLGAASFCFAHERWCEIKRAEPPNPISHTMMVLATVLVCLTIYFWFQPLVFENIVRELNKIDFP